jgi:hypothetical protein
MGYDPIFDRVVPIWGVPPGDPPKPLKTAKNVDFGYPPKNRVFGVPNARMAGLVHLLFRIFRKNLSLIRWGDPPKGGHPQRGQTPTRGTPQNNKTNNFLMYA